MSVVSMAETWEGRNASDSIDNSVDCSRTFHVRTDNAADDQVTIGAYVNLTPAYRLGAFHPNNPTIRISTRNFQQRSEDPCMWIVTLNYSRLLLLPGELVANGGSGGGGGNPEGEANPLLRAAVYSFTTETHQKLLDYDRSTPDPLPLVNSAGEPLDGATVEQAQFIFQSVKNVANFNWRQVRPLLYTCNQSPYVPIGQSGLYLFEPRELLLVNANAELVTEQFTYWRRTLTFRVANPDITNEQKWDPVYIMDRGFRRRKLDDDTKTVEIVDDNGHKPTRPVRLNGKGQQLRDDDDDVVLEFSIYPAKDWTPIQ